MLRAAFVCTLLISCCSSPAFCDSALETNFLGKQFVAKIDMPGTEKGIDLNFNKTPPMDWNEYSSRLKSFGVSIHKGDVIQITKFNVKKDMIEFQMNGGGYGTFGEDTNTNVSAATAPKSQLEKDLEKEISQTKDVKQKDTLQRDLDKERGRRERQDADNRNAAMVASQLKAKQLMQKRAGAGSRINLRWKGSIPSDSLNPDSVMQLLADYVDFNASTSAPPLAIAPGASPRLPLPGNGDVSQLKRGMKMEDVANVFGQGRPLSQSVSSDGLKTQLVEFTTSDSLVDVTFVEGVVVRYSISSK